MIRWRRLDEIIPAQSPLTATAQRVHSAIQDPITMTDQIEATRHSCKNFWDVALLGGPVLVRHGARAMIAEERLSSLQLIPGLVLSASSIGALPFTCVASGIISLMHRSKIVSPETAYVFKLKTAIKNHLNTPNRPSCLSLSEFAGEIALKHHVQWKVDEQPDRVQNSMSLYHWLRMWDSEIQASHP